MTLLPQEKEKGIGLGILPEDWIENFDLYHARDSLAMEVRVLGEYFRQAEGLAEASYGDQRAWVDALVINYSREAKRIKDQGVDPLLDPPPLFLKEIDFLGSREDNKYVAELYEETARLLQKGAATPDGVLQIIASCQETWRQRAEGKLAKIREIDEALWDQAASKWRLEELRGRI